MIGTYPSCASVGRCRIPNNSDQKRADASGADQVKTKTLPTLALVPLPLVRRLPWNQTHIPYGVSLTHRSRCAGAAE